MKAEYVPKSYFAGILILFLAASAFHRAQETAGPFPEAQIREAASRILKNADKANCKPRDCKIVVANFTLPSGLTSQFGVQLADQFSKELASQQNDIQVIDRSILQAYIDKERIPPDLLANDKAIRWLGNELKSTAMLKGMIQTEGSLVRVQVTLLSCAKEKAGPTEVFTLPLPDSKSALSGIDPITNLASKDESPSAPPAYRAGVGGVSQPACLYCPDPAYASAARAAKVQGSVLLKGVVSPEGKLVSAHIIRGLPFGLNEMALDAVRQWKFKPAALQGKPVAAEVTIEIGFRLN